MYLARDPTLDSVIHQHVGEPTHPTLSAAGMFAGKLFTTMGNFGYKSTCGILLCRRGEVLSAPRVFLVLKRSFTVSLSSLDVLFGSGWCVGLFCLGFVCCFCLVIGHPVFCIFTCSPTVREQLTDHATS